MKSLRLGAPGGREMDSTFAAGQLRADLCEIATACCYEHGARMVDKILESYRVTRRP